MANIEPTSLLYKVYGWKDERDKKKHLEKKNDKYDKLCNGK